MFFSRILPIGLIVACHFANAHVQIDTCVEFKTKTHNKRSINAKVKLEAGLPALVHESNDLRIEALVLDEQEKQAIVAFAVHATNGNGEFELVTAPTLSVTYGQTATLNLGSTNGDNFSMTLKTQKG